MKGNESDFAFISFHLFAFICIVGQPCIANLPSTMKVWPVVKAHSPRSFRPGVLGYPDRDAIRSNE
jgi:hypothetical protein